MKAWRTELLRQQQMRAANASKLKKLPAMQVLADMQRNFEKCDGEEDPRATMTEAQRVAEDNVQRSLQNAFADRRGER
jgi:hypothetical protein